MLPRYLVAVELAEATETNTLFGSEQMVQNKIKFMQHGVKNYLDKSFTSKLVCFLMSKVLLLYFKLRR